MIISYIFRQLVTNLFLFSLVLIGLLWLTQSLRFIEVIVNYNISLRHYFTLVIFLIPDLASLSLPICGVLSAVWVYYRLIVQHEFLAMQALGLSVVQLSRPLLGMGIFITCFCLVLNILIVPTSFRAFRDFEYQIRGNLSRVFLRPGAFTTIRGLTLYTDKHNEETGYELVLIDIPGKKPSTFVAESGYFDGRVFFLKKGYRQHHQEKHQGIETLSFEDLTYDISEFTKPQQGRLVKPHERDLDDLLWPSERLTKAMTQHFLIEGHQRLLMPFLSIIDMLLVVFFFLCKSSIRRRFQKRRLYQVLGSVLITHVGTYAVLNMCVKGSQLIFIPHVVIVGVGLTLAMLIKKAQC